MYLFSPKINSDISKSKQVPASVHIQFNDKILFDRLASSNPNQLGQIKIIDFKLAQRVKCIDG